jgi:hypothetical protein
MNHDERMASERLMRLLELERAKNEFFMEKGEEITFSYTASPPMITMSTYGAQALGLPEIIMDPMNNEQLQAMCGDDILQQLNKEMNIVGRDNSILHIDGTFCVSDKKMPVEMVCQIFGRRNDTDDPAYSGMIGKIICREA